MNLNGIGCRSVIIAVGLATLAALAAIRVYIVRELIVEFLFFCTLFAAIGIAVAILLVMDQIVLRTLMWVRAQITCAHLHFRHAAVAGNAITAAHKP